MRVLKNLDRNNRRTTQFKAVFNEPLQFMNVSIKYSSQNAVKLSLTPLQMQFISVLNDMKVQLSCTHNTLATDTTQPFLLNVFNCVVFRADCCP